MSAQSGKNGKGEKAGAPLFDRELEHLPQALRWREWMARVEAVIFAAPEPVSREILTQLIGRDCSLDLIIEDISAELADRPYELVRVAGGWQHRTRPAVADAIRSAFGIEEQGESLSEAEALVLMTIGYFQPITRSELSSFFAREISRDLIGKLRRAGFIASGPRSPQPGAPYTYVTTPGFLAHFGFETLRDLPDFEKLEDAGLLNKEKLLGDIPGAMERW
ncbi:SMC-Scp complex subunit ScpB [Nitratireductor aquimarinus]|uniref:SMC-Scp complex subunit ScpB n=1 Tax=Nitratireductor aquimarinus TaxID=889300 RepID=UPI001A8D4866|nr:SMC-Scp complex subunit ScpB [Nitratireductor aquimarinus]MBN8243521.1 SMC-Scp complex subunit ScpB [Nitratireductor aquimarinus]MBY6132238.1 SMC-Scp complex subunit ScpB [Nitratireductor aquimarinus]MCA1303265.1 SMC-Scp complex subunit ScpB [Nitratireductor aquimarinus]